MRHFVQGVYFARPTFLDSVLCLLYSTAPIWNGCFSSWAPFFRGRSASLRVWNVKTLGSFSVTGAAASHLSGQCLMHQAVEAVQRDRSDSASSPWPTSYGSYVICGASLRFFCALGQLSLS
ncbi:endoglucanase [Sesbania bispinosa]|nr:endoglucanase [Sesbania bispinosa]